MRVPSTGPKTTERQRRLKHLRSVLAELERLPAHRREDECADLKERSIRKVIDEIENGYNPVNPPDDLDELLRESPSYERMQRRDEQEKEL